MLDYTRDLRRCPDCGGMGNIPVYPDDSTTEDQMNGLKPVRIDICNRCGGEGYDVW
jgi:rRNA maturation protein Nop10